ncbi:peptide-N-glycosidase F-like protein [Jejuia pallidilutea]|uniref:Peptide-N-glycosidase F-like protein n=1 Tax=Jejuia pallidilutea TaxID=504487 RepID=A0A362X5B4_9FLAO|nr:PNGase F N-terminal domain-containing protein [Jejuia pallidilutea]PQV50221.1 peptide-N-glycosidase F-like protein [Jejuia pallidilutea]
MKKIIIAISLVVCGITSSQNSVEQTVFSNQIINYGKPDSTNIDPEVIRLFGGRLVIKKVTVPTFENGTDVHLKLKLRSNGDKWDKSGSCFVITNPDDISILDVANGNANFPKASYVTEKHGGVLPTSNYTPVIELLRFMTPFGVGHYSNDERKYLKPVYIPKWEKEVVWNQDISHLEDVVTGTFYIGVWIDSWTKTGYKFDVTLSYSGRAKKQRKVMSLVNTVKYGKGQALPYFFADGPLEYNFQLPKNLKNVKLHYITTGHGGHRGGDEFTKIKNSVYFDNKLVLDTIPWRDDCASFRRFNPTSGVWLRKDSAYYRDPKTRKRAVKEIEERLASSDLSRSNWCPGSKVEPFAVDLGDLEAGKHSIKITIPATKAEEGKANHWLVSAYITYE